MSILSIEHKRTTPCHTQYNGAVEREMNSQQATACWD